LPDTITTTNEQLRREQHQLDAMFARRDAELQAVVAELAGLSGGSRLDPQQRVEQQARMTALARRRVELERAESGLCFGRIDGLDGKRTYLGRIGLRDPGADDPLVVDWRAPVARTFYTATAAHPQGLRARRHISTDRRTVLGIDDEALDAGSTDSEVVGEAALIASLNARRTGAMGDIVATLQREQDDIIRAPRHGCLVVQGGPGTGKTAVALHRAGYLLFSYPRLAERGVLVIGPSTAFLHYIEQVLPSLGETQVVAATPATLLPGVTAQQEDSATAAEIKGRAVWAAVLQRAVVARQPAISDLRPRYGGEPLNIPAGQVAEVLAAASADAAGHHQSRELFRAGMLDLLARTVIEDGLQLLADVEKGFEDILATVDAGLLRERGGSGPAVPPAADPDLPSVRRTLAGDPQAAAAIESVWPALDPELVLSELLDDEQALAALAPELTDADRVAVVRHGSRWSAEDIALLDELADLVGAPTMLGGSDTIDPQSLAAAAGADRTWAFGHVIVDEAQELSAMQWRMLLRRCPSRSFTVVGDVNQAESPGSAGSWTSALQPVFGDRIRQVELTICYRTPQEVMARTAAVLAAAGSTVEAPHGVRSTGVLPWRRTVTADQLVEQVRESVAGLLDRYAGGRVAVIAPPDRCRALCELVAATTNGGDAVQVLEPAASKGLEFDAVLLVDPHGIVERRRGWNALYVAMTRCTQELGVLALGDGPPALEWT